MQVAIIGGGIAGLSLGINLFDRGISCHIYETAPVLKELGVGITLLPHAMRELTQIGIGAELQAAGVEIRESGCFTRFGQLIYREQRGRNAGYDYPEICIPRGRLHMLLYQAAAAKLGAAITTDRHCLAVEQDEHGVTLRLRETSTGRTVDPVRADIAIACDGVHSAVRQQFYPGEQVVYSGINSWRGVTRHKPILDGHTWLRMGSMRKGSMAIYPILDDIDEDGSQLVNWTAWIQSDTLERNDWNKAGKLGDFLPYYRDWVFDWFDLPEMLRNAEEILELPFVDKDPVARWSFGRTTLAGDAAHPMYPRGSNGSAQALVDVRTIADLLRQTEDAVGALKAYEAARLEPTAEIVRTNRSTPPDAINITIEELTGDKPFDNLDTIISQDELKALSERYKTIAGFRLRDVR